MDTISLYVTDPHKVVFASNGGFPICSTTPENVYRLILSEDEEHIILQGLSDRRIMPAEAEGNWVPRGEREYNAKIEQALVANLGISRWWKSSPKVHRSEERGWEEIDRWSSDEHESVLLAAKDAIATDQTTLEKAQAAEMKRQEKIQMIVGSLTDESSRV